MRTFSNGRLLVLTLLYSASSAATLKADVMVVSIDASLRAEVLAGQGNGQFNGFNRPDADDRGNVSLTVDDLPLTDEKVEAIAEEPDGASANATARLSATLTQIDPAIITGSFSGSYRLMGAPDEDTFPFASGRSSYLVNFEVTDEATTLQINGNLTVGTAPENSDITCTLQIEHSGQVTTFMAPVAVARTFELQPGFHGLSVACTAGVNEFTTAATVEGSYSFTFGIGQGAEVQCQEFLWLGINDRAHSDPNAWLGGVAPLVENATLPFTANVVNGRMTFTADATNDSVDVTTDDMTFDLGGHTYTLNGQCQDAIRLRGSNQPLGSNLKLENGNVRANAVTIGETAAGAALHVVAGASLIVDSLTSIGEAAGKVFLLVQTGGQFDGFSVDSALHADADVCMEVSGSNSSFTIQPNGEWTIGSVGTAGVTVKDGASVDVQSSAFDVVVGKNGVGTAAVQGTGTTWINRTGLVMAENSGALASVEVSDNASLEVQALMVVGQGGDAALTIKSSAAVEVDGICTIGAEAGSSSSAFVEDDGSWEHGDLLIVGDAGEGDLQITGGTVSSGTATLGLKATGKGAVSIIEEGEWTVTGAVNVGALGAGVVSVDADSTLTAQLIGVAGGGELAGTTIYVGSSNVSPAGRTGAGRPTTGIITECLSIEDGATIDVDAVTFDAGGLLSGTGTLAVPITNRGILAPGFGDCAAGPLTIDGDYVQEPAGELLIKLDSSDPAASGSLAVTGAATLGGALRIEAVNGYRPEAGRSFDIVSARQITGTFAAVTGSGVYDIMYDNDRVTATVVESPTQDLSGCEGQQNDDDQDEVEDREEQPVDLAMCGAGGSAGLTAGLLGLMLMRLSAASRRP